MISNANGRTAVVLAAVAVGQALLVGGSVLGPLLPLAPSEAHRALSWRVPGRGTTTGEPPDPAAYGL